MAVYDLTPVEVAPVGTKYRRIKTKLPVPESLPIFESLGQSEPRCMMGQPPIVWDKAEDFIVSDPWGNRWIDWSSGLLIQKGLLMFAPVGAAGECLKIAPPLTTPEDALRESIQVLEEAADEVLGRN
jgi:4-aminobutyrate aminotransferase-like enzyme